MINVTDLRTETVSDIDAAALRSGHWAPPRRDTVNESLREAVRRRLVDEYVAYLRAQDPGEVLERLEHAWR